MIVPFLGGRYFLLLILDLLPNLNFLDLKTCHLIGVLHLFYLNQIEFLHPTELDLLVDLVSLQDRT